MNKRLRFAAAVSFFVCLGILSAEDQPEIAYRILSGYIDNKEALGAAGNKIAGGVIAGTGGLFIAGAAVTWFEGDTIASWSGNRLDPQTKMGVAVGVGIGGLVLAGAGSALFAAKPHDFRSDYKEVFEENDSQVREAMSAAVLRDLSIKAEKARITGAISSLLVPLLSSAITAGINLTSGKVWYDGVVQSATWSAWSIAGGVAALFGTTDEERLYSKYLAAREALYGDRAPSN